MEVKFSVPTFDISFVQKQHFRIMYAWIEAVFTFYGSNKKNSRVKRIGWLDHSEVMHFDQSTARTAF